jgi:hypothetical protein
MSPRRPVAETAKVILWPWVRFWRSQTRSAYGVVRDSTNLPRNRVKPGEVMMVLNERSDADAGVLRLLADPTSTGTFVL